MHFASFVLTLAPLFVSVRAKGGFTATCTDVSFAPGPNVQANCQSTAGIVFTSVNLNKCIAQNGNKLQCAHKYAPHGLWPTSFISDRDQPRALLHRCLYGLQRQWNHLDLQLRGRDGEHRRQSSGNLELQLCEVGTMNMMLEVAVFSSKAGSTILQKDRS
ncbi:hypothetical protein GGX14DRAFT_409121 [Mycena pura]|uniref:Cyanovirin-N domain-containing protein n=1 Tax=Mycena pura TaxID=153505 RepID=A0AAD6URQ5_9AGAR|nr:hypothetical protein GGX14DRAFT_409121 [Mycena pura]